MLFVDLMKLYKFFPWQIVTGVCPVYDGSDLSQEGRKEIFYLTMHSTHFIYGYMLSDMVEDHSENERGNLLQQGIFYMHHPTDRITHTTVFVIPVMEHWLEWDLSD